MQTTNISNFFIDTHLKDTNASFIAAYIALLRLCAPSEQGSGECSISEAADFMGVLECDIRRALAFWEKKEAIRFSEENGALKIDFILEGTNQAYRLPAVAVSRPVYTNEEMDFYIKNNSSVRELFKKCQNNMGKLLSYNDMQAIFSFHDWLRMSFELIELLVEYCCSNGHNSIRYIEKVAVVWADAGINTPEKAKERIKLYNKDFRRVMAALGKHDREPVKAEEALMLKWLKTYALPLEVVEAACEKTMMTASRPSFKYADGIIEKWYQAGVTTLDEVESAEREYRAQSEKVVETPAKTSKKTKFSNFKERESTDFSEIQRLEMELIDRELGMIGAGN